MLTPSFRRCLTTARVVANFVLGALAHLQLGRAKILSGDNEGGRKAYQDFFRHMEGR